MSTDLLHRSSRNCSNARSRVHTSQSQSQDTGLPPAAGLDLNMKNKINLEHNAIPQSAVQQLPERLKVRRMPELPMVARAIEVHASMNCHCRAVESITSECGGRGVFKRLVRVISEFLDPAQQLGVHQLRGIVVRACGQHDTAGGI